MQGEKAPDRVPDHAVRVIRSQNHPHRAGDGLLHEWDHGCSTGLARDLTQLVDAVLHALHVLAHGVPAEEFGARAEKRQHHARTRRPGENAPKETDNVRRYPLYMSAATAGSEALRIAVATNRAALDEVLLRYRARNPRLFGSVARGEANGSSDLDVLVDLDVDGGNELLRVAGIGEEFSRILNTPVDVVTSGLLRDAVSATALAEAIPL